MIDLLKIKSAVLQKINLQLEGTTHFLWYHCIHVYDYKCVLYIFLFLFLSQCSWGHINFTRNFPTPDLLLKVASPEHLLTTLQRFHYSQQKYFTNEAVWRSS